MVGVLVTLFLFVVTSSSHTHTHTHTQYENLCACIWSFRLPASVIWQASSTICYTCLPFVFTHLKAVLFSVGVRHQLFGIYCGIHPLTLFDRTWRHVYSLDIKCLCIVVFYVIALYKLSFTYLLTYLLYLANDGLWYSAQEVHVSSSVFKIRSQTQCKPLHFCISMFCGYYWHYSTEAWPCRVSNTSNSATSLLLVYVLN